ncbi:VOC family protein [Streptomyces lincolnensis]|uniref:VOC family protein n=1 Tax=Streptomyces lincolnensis TaxID=1915 RepID=UPI0037D40F23
MTAPYQKMIFVSLPVTDLEASKKFYAALGFTPNAQYSDENTATFQITDAIVAMLHTRQRYSEFTKKEISDATNTSQMLLGLSAETRAEVDDVVEKAFAAGATPAAETQDHGFMYNRSFDDLDGHTWEVVWMDPAADQAQG